MDDLGHLNEDAVQLAGLDNAERMHVIYEDRWVDYPRAIDLLDVLNGVLARPRTTRMASVAVYADSGMGKTMLLQRFLTQHQASFDKRTGVERTPVLSLQMASRPSEKRFYTQIMDVVGAPPNPRVSLADLEVTALRMLRHIDLKMLLIDETHNILAATYNEQRAMLNLLRYISNELRVSVVCFGLVTTWVRFWPRKRTHEESLPIFERYVRRSSSCFRARRLSVVSGRGSGHPARRSTVSKPWPAALCEERTRADRPELHGLRRPSSRRTAPLPESSFRWPKSHPCCDWAMPVPALLAIMEHASTPPSQSRHPRDANFNAACGDGNELICRAYLRLRAPCCDYQSLV
jgi:hypothetical protein